jgi:hypothetical protein
MARPRPSQLLETQQHRQHPFELAVEMDLIAAQSLQLVGIERLAERLFSDQRPVEPQPATPTSAFGGY